MMLNFDIKTRAFSDINGSTLVQLNDCTCLGYTQSFECTIFGAGVTIWGSSTFVNCENEYIRLRHSRFLAGSRVTADNKCNDGAVIASSIGESEGCY